MYMYVSIKLLRHCEVMIYICHSLLIPVQRKKRPRVPSATPNPPKLTRMMIRLWELTAEHKDGLGRQVAAIFMVLPTRKELPEYYQIIKKPIDLRKIKVGVLQGLGRGGETVFMRVNVKRTIQQLVHVHCATPRIHCTSLL